MNNGIIITVNLPGRLEGSVRHTETQTIKTDISPEGSRKPIWATKEITHTDRKQSDCYLKVNISEEVVDSWTGGKPPYHVKARDWQKYGRNKKIAAYVAEFDRGYGVDFSSIGE